MANIDAIVQAALEIALWTGIDEDGESPLDDRFDITDFPADSVALMRENVEGFLSLVGDDADGLSDEMIGHDFVLTAQHHGAGFWDRGLGAQGDRLTHWAHTYSVEVYVGDDDLPHIS